MAKVFTQIGTRIKEKLEHVSAKEMQRNIKEVYLLLNLMNEEGEWASDKLDQIAPDLFNEDLIMEDVNDFIDQVVLVNKKNRYLKKHLPLIGKRQYNTLMSKFELEGDKIIPKVVAYAMALENLTKACADDWTVLSDVYDIFALARENKKTFKVLPLFHKIKLISVNIPMKKTYIAAHRTETMSPNSGGIAVAINIAEATFTDFKSGNKGNAYCGKVLATNKCGKVEQDDRTGAGPSGFSADKKMIERRYPLPKKWAALYQTWNMDFCLRFRDFPFVISKLLIPQVASYHDKPYEYINNRAIALFIYLHFAGFDYISKQEKGEKIINWHDKKLMMDWGRLNKIAAKSYEKDIKAALEG